MAKWQNWSGRHATRDAELHFIRSEADAIALVTRCASERKSLRVAGTGHSHAPVAVNHEVMVDSSGLTGVLDVDTANRQAWIRAGSPIYSLGGQLHAHGQALRNQGDIDRQLLAGTVSTGTHGTGKDLQNISASVIDLSIITADGDHIENCAASEPELFEAARVGLGSVGFITRIRMQLRDACVLKEKSWQADYDDFARDIPALVDGHDRFEFFWYPQSDTATIKTIAETSEPPVYPLAEEGSRQAWSYEVLPSHRPHLHTEMEYSVPAESGPDCLADIRQLLQTQFKGVSWPVEYRTVAADDIWLSMASGRPTVTISVHQDIREGDEPYFRACEEVFLQYGGRPHWGKVNYLTSGDFAELYPHWEKWWQIRENHDPHRIFLNPWARRLAP